MVSYDQGQRKIVHLIILPARGYWEELRMRCSITPIGRGVNISKFIEILNDYLHWHNKKSTGGCGQNSELL